MGASDGYVFSAMYESIVPLRRSDLSADVMPDVQPAPVLCLNCSEPMKLVRTVLKLYGTPQLFAFCCVACGVAETREPDNEQRDLNRIRCA